ncbi:MAG: DUF4383 domain-containing protein [Candidatus Paceibacterota bacterium]
MNTQQAAKWFGWIILAVGILGFIPGIVTPSGLLLGIFSVDAMHNIIHILTGIVALASAGTLKGAKLYFKIFGIVYALVTILGLMSSNGMVLGMMMNTADNLLHVVITLFALYFGFRNESTTVTM